MLWLLAHPTAFVILSRQFCMSCGLLVVGGGVVLGMLFISLNFRFKVPIVGYQESGRFDFFY